MSAKFTMLTRGALLAAMLLGSTALSVAQDDLNITVAIQSMGNAGSIETVENTGTAARKFQNSVFEQLIALNLQDPNLSAKPGLATEWHWVDPTTLELKLRPNVKFHNGDTMTAEDVVFSFSEERFGMLPEQAAARERGETTFIRADGTTGIVPPATVAAGSATAWPQLDHVEAVDDLTVRFIMTQPTLDTEARLARVNYAAIISKRAYLETPDWNTWAANPVATGPYKVDNIEPGSAIHLVAHADYWDGTPPVDKLDILVVPEAASRLNGLISGEYDIISDVGPDQVPLLQDRGDFDVVGGPVANIRFIALDTRHGPLQNLKVRQALSHSIDRQTIVDVLWSGLTEQAQGFQHASFGDLFATDHHPPEYDPELAKQLLAEAGYNGEAINYRANNDYYPNELTVAQFNLENLRAIGFNIDFAVGDAPVDATDTRMMGELSNTAYFAFPIALLGSYYCPGGQYNSETNPNGMWQNDEFDELCEVMNTSLDRAEVKAAFTRALDILENEDPALLVLHQNAILYGKRSDIEWASSPMFVMDFGPHNFAIKD